MLRILATFGLVSVLGACGYVSEYEKAVYDMEPTYCYKSIGNVACYNKPFHRDEMRLVNYFGPDPSRYDKPEPPGAAPHAPPKMVNYWVKDAEPIPRPAANGQLTNLPWLDPVLNKAEADKQEVARLSTNPKGTQALLSYMGIGPNTVIKARPAPRPAPQPAPQPAQTTVQPTPAAQPKPPVIEVDVF
ncbi:MAG: hypothetical protein O3A85_00010 [Proteobacteria bacterium]|nr:hypothetical protein [Pseudomonadota bacterium]